jgi:hypothetical protein
MLKKFIEGLSFGGGFAISFVLIWFVAFYLIYPRFIESKLEQSFRENLPGKISAQPSGTGASAEAGLSFHELDLKDQIQEAGVIALAKYKPSAEGKVKAVITEFLKRDPKVTFYYEAGDEFPSSSYYPRENISYGDGEVLFFRRFSGNKAIINGV